MKALIATIGLAAIASANAVAAPGDLDGNFGTSGISRINLGISVAVTGAALANTGKIIVVGSHSQDIFIARVNRNGAIDSTFGADHDGDGTLDGYLLHDLGGNDAVVEVVVDSLDRINLVGGTDAFGPYQMSLTMRLNPDGSLDSTYGALLGTLGYSLGCVYAYGKDLVIDPISGNLVTVDSEEAPFGTSQGLLSTFDSAGILGYFCTGISPSNYLMGDSAAAIALQDSDNKTIVAGYTGNDIYLRRFVAGLNVSDSTYGTIGTAILSRLTVGGPGTVARVNDIVIDQDSTHPQYDKTVIVGNADANILAARFDSTGTLDTAFAGGAGFRSINFGATETGSSGVIDGRGRLLVVGDSNGDSIALARIRRNGNLDGGFGPTANGMVETFIGFGTSVKSGLLNSQGKILVVGSAASLNEILLARYRK